MQFAPSIVAKLRAQAARHGELTEMLSSPEILADTRRLPALLQERGALESLAELAARLDVLETRRREAEAILAEPRPDPELAGLAREELAQLEPLEQAFDEELKQALVSDKEDLRRKVIVEIRAGVGGDEATLFARDLYGIYKKYCEARRWKVEEFEVSTSEIGGFKEVVFAVEGEGTWARLRFESGGHRVQRVPATEAQGRIHTSAATVAVLPEAEEVDVQIRPDDLRIDTMRDGGAGGQHVNKTESAVRITHIPTGIAVHCQQERSQHKNRAVAMRILRSKLLEVEEKKQAEKMGGLHAQKKAIEWGSQIRSYVLHPYRLAKDHRTKLEVGDVDRVLNGDLDPFIKVFLVSRRDASKATPVKPA